MTRGRLLCGVWSRAIDSLRDTDDVHFAVDTIRNVFWFCVIGLAALGLQTFVHWTRESGGSGALIVVLTIVEYAVLIADVIWFMSRLLVGTFKVIMRAYREITAEKAAGAGLVAIVANNPTVHAPPRQ